MSKYLDDTSNPTKEWMRDRLEDAMQTHDLLPPAIRQDVRTMYHSIALKTELNAEEAETAMDTRLNATGMDIKRMDQVFSWIRQLPGTRAEKCLKAKVLFLRAHLRGDQPMSWRKIAARVGVSHVKAEYVHDRAIWELIEIARKSV